MACIRSRSSRAGVATSAPRWLVGDRDRTEDRPELPDFFFRFRDTGIRRSIGTQAHRLGGLPVPLRHSVDSHSRSRGRITAAQGGSANSARGAQRLSATRSRSCSSCVWPPPRAGCCCGPIRRSTVTRSLAAIAAGAGLPSAAPPPERPAVVVRRTGPVGQSSSRRLILSTCSLERDDLPQDVLEPRSALQTRRAHRPYAARPHTGVRDLFEQVEPPLPDDLDEHLGLGFEVKRRSITGATTTTGAADGPRQRPTTGGSVPIP